MNARAYYNENDPKAAAWLRELIKAGLIADGEVDERSIELVQPGDLAGFVQCHFFAGIGGWSYALRLAGWPDAREVWTGSCPCQPFSSAGKGDGAADSRHLWPAWFRLIGECRPVAIFGEQVASADGLGWFDRVSTDLEASGYAIGAADLCAAGIGAFHIRQRLWFVADSEGQRGQRLSAEGRSRVSDRAGRSEVGELAHSENTNGRHRIPGDHWTEAGDDRCGCWDRDAFHRTRGMLPGEVCVNKGRVADSQGGGLGIDRSAPRQAGHAYERGEVGPLDDTERDRAEREAGSEGRQERTASGGREDEGRRQLQALHASAVGFWSACEWLPFRDGKYRPVEPGTFPLAHGLPARVGRLRGYGNAIVPQVAAEVIAAYMEICR